MYQVLARKYRPRNFNELVGQNHVSRALTSALECGRLHHAYLFTGTRGVGKTTIARILAKCLNCETGVTSTPCEVCPTCRAVNEGRFIDLIEIDAASRTRVEDTRELLDNVPYAPTQGRFKVYLIDEVHMLSTHSFNALLKTLEEPPEHVKFLFATTDPQKLPITVVSRCLQFTLRPLDITEISGHLTEILNKEDVEYESEALWQIAEAAQGSLRDSLSLTDQAIAYGQGKIIHDDVKDMLGLIDRSIIYDLIEAIHQNHQKQVSLLLLQFRKQALDVALVLDQLVSTLHELALIQYLPDLGLKYSHEINQKIKRLSQLISAQDLQLYYQIATKGRAEITWAVTQEQGFEMCVLRMLAFRPLSSHERPVIAEPIPVVNDDEHFEPEVALESSTEETLASIPSKELDDASIVAFDAAAEDHLIEVSVPSHSQYIESSVDYDKDDEEVFPFSLDGESTQFTSFEVDRNDEVERNTQPVNKEKRVEETSTQLMPQEILSLPEQELSGAWTVEKWEYWFRNSDLSPAVQELAQYGIMSGEINATCQFYIPQKYEKLLNQQQHNLEEALKQQWSNTVLSISYEEVSEVTPYMLQIARKERAYERAVTLIKEEPSVKALIDTFDAEIHNIQLKT